MSTEIPTAAWQGLRCPHCGSASAEARRFCGDCGRPFNEASEAERRHLTVMFCDLVGSTALSERLDPEEFGDILLGYREVVSTAVQPYAGFVARYVGDGVLIYFGYPKAHGDDPVRALHAALGIVEAMGAVSRQLMANRGIELAVRIGVHTGLVMVGDLARGDTREEAGVMGETPNLAARLIDLAAPNSVIVSEVTHSLAAAEFAFEALGPSAIKGLSRSVAVHRLVAGLVRPEPVQFGLGFHVTTMVNRTQELVRLRAAWERSLQGHGQALRLCGEPGIGKSRLLRAFADELAGMQHRRLVFQCSPYFSNSALHPVVTFLNSWLESEGGDRIERLAAMANDLGMNAEEVVPVLAQLLSLPLPAPYVQPERTAALQRAATMAFLSGWITRIAAESPTLLVVEDLQWTDASSIELLARVLEHTPTERMLVLISSRESAAPAQLSQVPSVAVDRMSSDHMHEMVSLVASGHTIPPATLDRVVKQSDGVPLFAEELTKAVVGADDSHARRPADDADIPISLHATLMARLDNLRCAKVVAQRAAILGREFSYELLAAVADVGVPELDRGLEELVAAQLLFQRGAGEKAVYSFKHSLIQETAYRSLLRAHRRRHHQRVADVLMARARDQASAEPEIIAHHLSEAHQPAAAATYWRKAGEAALSRSANAEACAHFRKGLQELAKGDDSPVRVREQILLLLALGSALSAMKGSAAPEVEQTYGRASELCKQVDDPAYLFPALRGLHSFYLVRGPLRTARRMAEQLWEMAERQADLLPRVEARRRLGWCLFCMGRIAEGRRALLEALEMYDPTRAAQHIVTFGSDPGIIGLVNMAWLECFAGNAQAAIDYSDRAMHHARRLSYGLGMAYSHGMSAAVYQCMGQPARTRELATQTIALAQRHGFPYWSAWETALLGWARAMEGEIEAGGALLREGLLAYRETGSELFVPHMLAMQAEVELRAGRADEALALCEEALSSSERSDAHFLDAEIRRVEAEALWSRDRDRAAAATALGEAILVARAQGAGLLEQRASRSLRMVESAGGA